MNLATQPNLHPTPIAPTMAMQALHSSAHVPRPRSGAAANAASMFSAKLASRSARVSQGSQPAPVDVSQDDQHTRLKRQTEKWVAQTFYGSVLKEMHQSPFKSKIFDGGRGGQAFGSLFDQKLAERMSRGAGGKLADSIVRKIEGRHAYQVALAAEKKQSEALRQRIERSNAERENVQQDGARRKSTQPLQRGQLPVNSASPGGRLVSGRSQSSSMRLGRDSVVHVPGRGRTNEVQPLNQAPQPAHTFRAPRALFDPTMTKKARMHVAAGH